MYSVRFTQIARTELIQAQDWYKAEAPGLGRQFREAVDAVTEHMSINPPAAIRPAGKSGFEDFSPDGAA